MPAYYEIKFLPEGPVTRFAGSRGNYYEFEDGSHSDMETTPVWCHRCKEIIHGEEIESLDVINQKIADLHDPMSEHYRIIKILSANHKGVDAHEKFRLDEIEKAEKRRQWREQRRSGPKCIHCGSTDIFVFPVNQEVPNPAGQGTVEVSFVGMCSTEFNQWFFTPEGERIPKGTKPTRWHIQGKAGPAAGEHEKG
jgi:hypothetical protein